MAIEKTFILVKPDGVKKNLVGNILARFEAKGLKIVALKMIVAPKEVAETHYAEQKEKPFFGELVDFITSSPLVAAVIEGENAIKAVRQLNGATNPLEAVPGSIRGDYALTIVENIVHGSDSPEAAAREIANWFKPEEIC